MVCHSLLQSTTFCQNSPPWPFHLGWPHTMAHTFIELDKAVVHVIRFVSFLWLWFSVCLPSDGAGTDRGNPSALEICAGHIQTTARRLVAGAYRKWWSPCQNHGQSITKCHLFNHLKIILNHALLSIPQLWLIFSPMLTSLVANFSSMHFTVWILDLCY